MGGKTSGTDIGLIAVMGVESHYRPYLSCNTKVK